jgi:bacillithiol system protein YtxJ
MGAMEILRETTEFDRLLRAPLAIVFKHSTSCGISAQAHREVERFLVNNPKRAFHKVEVVESRVVSDYIASKTGVRHESPQLLVLRNGDVVWHGSHSRITVEAIGLCLG